MKLNIWAYYNLLTPMIAATSADYSQQSHDYQSWLQSIWVIQAQVAAIDAGSNIAGTVVNGALSATHFIYQFEVKESGVNTWPATREYRIEVFVDSVLTETLYINNSSADASNVEGVTARVTLGAGPTLADNLTVKVQKISND